MQNFNRSWYKMFYFSKNIQGILKIALFTKKTSFLLYRKTISFYRNNSLLDRKTFQFIELTFRSIEMAFRCFELTFLYFEIQFTTFYRSTVSICRKTFNISFYRISISIQIGKILFRYIGITFQNNNGNIVLLIRNGITIKQNVNKI